MERMAVVKVYGLAKLGPRNRFVYHSLCSSGNVRTHVKDNAVLAEPEKKG